MLIKIIYLRLVRSWGTDFLYSDNGPEFILPSIDPVVKVKVDPIRSGKRRYKNVIIYN